MLTPKEGERHARWLLEEIPSMDAPDKYQPSRPRANRRAGPVYSDRWVELLAPPLSSLMERVNLYDAALATANGGAIDLTRHRPAYDDHSGNLLLRQIPIQHRDGTIASGEAVKIDTVARSGFDYPA